MPRTDFEKIPTVSTCGPSGCGLAGTRQMGSGPNSWITAWSGSNALGTGMGLLQGVTGIASAAANNYKIDDTEAIEEQIDSVKNTKFDYGDFDSLQSAYSPIEIDRLTGDDLRSSDGERFTNTLSAIGSGFSAGAAFGPVGMAVGAGVGLLGSIGGIWAGNIKAGKEAVRLNKEADEAQRAYQINFANNAQNIAQSNFNRAALNLAAYGGMLKDNNINNFLKSKMRLAEFNMSQNNKNRYSIGDFVDVTQDKLEEIRKAGYGYRIVKE